MSSLKFHVPVWLLATSLTSAAEPSGQVDEVFITATRASAGLATSLLGSSYTIIGADDLEDRQVRVLADVLRDVPGVSVNRAGVFGGQTQVRLRGGESNHTYVLIDGIEANDPFNGEFEFATLIADRDARVEVLRGAQSALYGSDAVGGVVHYITATGGEAPGLHALVEGGSFESTNAGLRWGGVAGNLDYSVSGSYLGTAGVAPALTGTRETGNWVQSYATKATWSPLDNFRVRIAGRFVQARAQYDDQDFNFPSPTYGLLIDTDSYYQQQNTYGLLRGELELLDGRWSQALGAQRVDGRRRDYSYSLGGNFFIEGTRDKFSYETTYRFGANAARQAVTFAVDRKQEIYQNLPIFGTGPANLRRKLNNTGVVGEYELQLGERWGFGAAVRHDANSYFEDADTFRLQGSYRFDHGLKLRAAAGSGVKNPTNFELFGFDPTSFQGNADLKPEKSTGWEAGLDQSLLAGALKLGVTYFDSTLRDEIFTRFLPGSISSPANRTTDSTRKGVEATVNARLGNAWRVDLAYTYLDSLENGLEEVRRPPHSGSVNVAWRGIDQRAGVELTVRYNGTMLDDDFGTGNRVSLASFTLVNLGMDWKLSGKVTAYARVENLFDEEYQEVYSYGSVGRAGYVGLRAGL